MVATIDGQILFLLPLGKYLESRDISRGSQRLIKYKNNNKLCLLESRGIVNFSVKVCL